MDETRSKSASRFPLYVTKLLDGSFQCLWCDSKQLACADILEAHLRGKDHNKRCGNSGISPYGSASHNQEATDYITLYGSDPWARLKHWPTCIVEKGMYWECVKCAKKKFQTQRAVNDHLQDRSHFLQDQATADLQSEEVPSENQELPPQEPWERDPSWPAYIVDEQQYWMCILCTKKFNAKSTVEQHLKHPRHLSKLTPSAPTAVPHLPGQPVNPTVREKALAKDRRERFGSFINIEKKECFLCEKSFGSISQVEDHFHDLLHLANWYESTIDCLFRSHLH